MGLYLFSLLEFVCAFMVGIKWFPSLRAWWHRKSQIHIGTKEPEYRFITEFKPTKDSEWAFHSQYRTGHSNVFGLFIVLRMGYDEMLKGLDGAMWANGWYAARIILQSPSADHQPLRLCYGAANGTHVEYFPPSGSVKSLEEYSKLPAVKA